MRSSHVSVVDGKTSGSTGSSLRSAICGSITSQAIYTKVRWQNPIMRQPRAKQTSRLQNVTNIAPLFAFSHFIHQNVKKDQAIIRILHMFSHLKFAELISQFIRCSFSQFRIFCTLHFIQAPLGMAYSAILRSITLSLWSMELSRHRLSGTRQQQ